MFDPTKPIVTLTEAAAGHVHRLMARADNDVIDVPQMIHNKTMWVGRTRRDYTICPGALRERDFNLDFLNATTVSRVDNDLSALRSSALGPCLCFAYTAMGEC